MTGTPEDLARIVHETEQSPSVVRELWAQFKMGAGTPTEEQEEARDLDRLAREYDEQIAAMDEDLVRKRRGVFIAGADDSKDAPPVSRGVKKK